MTTLQTVQEIIVNKFGLDPAELDPDVSLDGLGIDSLAVNEIIFDLEDIFRIRIPSAPVDIKNLQDIVTLVDRLLLEQHVGAE